MSVTLTYVASVTVDEILPTNVVAVATDAQKTVRHSSYNTTKSLNGASSPPVTQCAFFSKALSTGAATIDLTALTGTNGATVDCSGLKVQVFKAKNPSTNANQIAVTFGASNGYLLGGAAWKLTLQPGMEITVYGSDQTPDVGGSSKTIDIAGTGSQALEVSIVAG